MNDYSDLIYLMAAMIIFSILSLNAAFFFNINEQFQYQSEIEYNGIAVAQDIIDQVRWIQNEDLLDESDNDCICDEYPKTLTISFDDYELEYVVDISINDTSITGSTTINRIVEVTVSNEYLPDAQQIKMKYLKSFSNKF